MKHINMYTGCYVQYNCITDYWEILFPDGSLCSGKFLSRKSANVWLNILIESDR